MANIANIIQSTIASAERVFEMMDEEEEKDEIPANINQVAGEEHSIVFDHVKFGYTPDKPLMTDLNIHVEEGQMVAIVGPTGAGKTTIINLLMRFYDVDGGQIRMKGIDTRDMTKMLSAKNSEWYCKILGYLTEPLPTISHTVVKAQRRGSYRSSKSSLCR